VTQVSELELDGLNIDDSVFDIAPPNPRTPVGYYLGSKVFDEALHFQSGSLSPVIKLVTCIQY